MQDLAGGQCSLTAVSERFGVSGRTLQRQLVAEGKSFKELLQSIQLEMTLLYLDMGISLEEIANLVGYTELNSFQRAFKQWTGQTVSQYRRRIDQ